MIFRCSWHTDSPFLERLPGRRSKVRIEEAMTSHSPQAVAEHISKRFYATQALDDISVIFNAGEVHALIGENGAGKSTLMKIFGGVHHPDSGRLLIDGSKPPRIDPASYSDLRLISWAFKVSFQTHLRS